MTSSTRTLVSADAFARRAPCIHMKAWVRDHTLRHVFCMLCPFFVIKGHPRRCAVRVHLGLRLAVYQLGLLETGGVGEPENHGTVEMDRSDHPGGDKKY